jgi:hypothetical protein
VNKLKVNTKLIIPIQLYNRFIIIFEKWFLIQIILKPINYQKQMMKTILINTKNQKELDFLQTLVHKLGFKSTVLSEEEKENMALMNAMNETENGKVYSLNEAQAVYKTLKKAK